MRAMIVYSTDCYYNVIGETASVTWFSLSISYGYYRRKEVVEGWGRLHSEELCNLCCSPNIVRVIISRGIRWAGHIACIEVVRSAYFGW
jgi:hypothetical protein